MNEEELSTIQKWVATVLKPNVTLHDVEIKMETKEEWDGVMMRCHPTEFYRMTIRYSYQKPQDTLLGYPVVVSDKMPEVKEGDIRLHL